MTLDIKLNLTSQTAVTLGNYRKRAVKSVDTWLPVHKEYVSS